MPKSGARDGLEKQIAQILAAAAPQIASAVRAHLTMLLSGRDGGALGSTATSARGFGPKQHHTFPTHCIHPGCSNDHRGPRWSFLCEKHRDISKSEKQKYLATWRAGQKKSGPGKATKRNLTAEGRKRLSELMRARWAKKKGKKSGAAKA
jgi:hypothetical protein